MDGMEGMYHPSANLVDLLRRRASTQPELALHTFLPDGEQEGGRLTCSSLDHQARSLAARLQQMGLQGERALLLYPPGLDFITAFFGCLYASVVAVPAYPPKANRSFSRLRAILMDAKAAVVLSVGSVLTDIRQSLSEHLGGPSPAWLATDQNDDLADQWRPPVLDPRALAFLQYTSGSTGDPKGVMVTHGNVLSNSECIRRAFELDASSVGVCWLPSFHDMGLISGVVQPLYTGFSTYLMPPAAFLQKPVRWLRAVSRYRGTLSGGPNSGYELCLRGISPDQMADLDLSCWKGAFNGAEPIHADTVDRFCRTFAAAGFRAEALFPCFGMAEATLMVTGGPLARRPVMKPVRTESFQQHRIVAASADEPAATMLVSSGQPTFRTTLAIVDPEKMTRVQPGQVGEIWVAGPSVAQGYWNRPEPTRDTFQARIADTGEGPFLRTGDLGFIEDGGLFVTGRHKDLIIIHGRNYYPQDIELTVERSDSGLAPGTAAAFSVQQDNQERLVVAVEVQRQFRKSLDRDAVFTTIRQAVAEEHELQIHAIVLLAPTTVPKTSSGKIQRRPCREAFLAGTLDAIASWQSPPIVEERQAVLPNEATEAGVEQWLREYVGRHVGLPAGQVDVGQPFTHYGLGSIEAVALAGSLEQYLGRPVPQTLAYDRPSIAAVVRWLETEGIACRGDAGAPCTGTVVRNEATAVPNEPIAVVGMGCRFPGGPDPERFWKALREGRDCITNPPPGRFPVRAGAEDREDRRILFGGYLDEVDGFDAEFFGIAPREADKMDPQQRLLLEVAWETLENAACDPRRLAGTDTGVFVGVSGSDYLRLLAARSDGLDAYVGTGGANSIAANRLSYWLDLRGPSLAVDTACSSSLVAVHLACRGLRQGECRAALAGGVNLILSDEVSRVFSQAGMLAADGRCKTFAAGADGYVRGEGCGLVLLKRLSDARADGDRILAVIRGTAVNQDGRSNGLTAPNGPAQQAVIRDALADAGLIPSAIDYVEAHGTGTELGDPIEAQALGAVLGESRPSDRPLLIGSVKTNIGHLESAAGVAGLLKVILALQYRELPPHLNCPVLNPHVPWDRLPVRVVTERMAWSDAARPRVAGISSFGFGGTNAHVIVESAQESSTSNVADGRPVHVLALSAATDEALTAVVGRYVDHFAAHADLSLADVCSTATGGRMHFRCRAAVAASDLAECRQQLENLRQGQEVSGAYRSSPDSLAAPRLAFLFTGQGSQYVGMGRRLCDSQPVFRGAMDRCERAFRSAFGRSLLSVVHGLEGETSDELNQTLNAQPALFALEWSLAQLWQSWGLRPAVVMGHSLGEYAAACVAGVFGLEDGLRLVSERARLMHEAPGEGKMAAVFAGEARVAELLKGESKVSVAAVNGPAEVVISGHAEAVEKVLAALSRAGVCAQPLKVSHAFHSPLMEPIAPDFEKVASAATFGRPTLAVISNLTGEVVAPEAMSRVGYWLKHLRRPVRFADGVRTLIASGVNTIVEIGPHPTLTTLARQMTDDESLAWLPSLRRGQDDRQAIARLPGPAVRTGCGDRLASV